MRNSVRRAIAASAIAAALLGGSAHAATTIFTDKSAFLAGLTTSITDDYSNAAYHAGMTDAQVSAVINEADYTSPKGTFTVGSGYLHVLSFGCNAQYYSPTCPTTNLGSQISLADTSLSNGGSVYAVGFTYYYDQRSVATVTFGDGSTQVLNLVLPILPTFPDTTITPRFVGIESTLGIKSIDFVGVPAKGYDEWLDKEYSFYTGNLLLDDLTIGSNGKTAAVPEPATWAMMIVGFFGVGGLARRKARAIAA